MKPSLVVTQSDIAEALGVSINTVSHALRGLSDISKETIDRVREKAREMGYVPNSMAIKLKTGNTKTIALVYDNLVNPFFTIMASKLLALIKEKGYDTIIFPCSNYFEIPSQTLNELIELHVDGILSFLDINEALVTTKAFQAFPIVIVGRLSKFNITSIYSDDLEGGRIVGRYFKNKNYQKVLYAGPEMINESSKRCNGLEEIYQSQVIKTQYREQDDTNKVIELIKQEHVEAVFAFNDVLAMIITKAIKAHGLDIEVVGYDSIHEQLPFVNDVTSIQFDFDALAELSVSSLLEIIENPETEIKQIKIPVKLHTKGDH